MEEESKTSACEESSKKFIPFDELPPAPILIKGRYRHFKTGGVYTLLSVARKAEAPTKYTVVYEGAHGDVEREQVRAERERFDAKEERCLLGPRRPPVTEREQLVAHELQREAEAERDGAGEPRRETETRNQGGQGCEIDQRRDRPHACTF